MLGSALTSRGQKNVPRVATGPRCHTRYGIEPGDNDTSVTAWAVQALTVARRAKLSISDKELKKALKGAMNWLEHATTKKADRWSKRQGRIPGGRRRRSEVRLDGHEVRKR